MAIQVVLIGIIMAAAIWWQIYLIRKNHQSEERLRRRITPPLVVSIIIFLGVTMLGIIRWHDPLASNYHFSNFMKTVGLAILFVVLLNVKAYLGPLVVGISVSFFAYYLLEYQRFQTIPILKLILELVIERAPLWVQYAYAIIIGSYSAVCSFLDGDFL